VTPRPRQARPPDDRVKGCADRGSGAGLRRPVGAALAAVLVTGGWALGQTHVGALLRRPPVAPAPVPPTCSRSCRAAYEAIAKALPRERGELLDRAILATPGFDYLQLDHWLRIPTSAQIHAQWRRSCRERFPSGSQAAAACIRSIDSWTPIPLPASPSWAAS
jgi:hypothetical protein